MERVGLGEGDCPEAQIVAEEKAETDGSGQVSESVEVNFSWEWFDCGGCGAIWRTDELKRVENNIGGDVFVCRCCGTVIGIEDL